MHHTFGRDQCVGHFLNGGGLAFQYENFQAVVMIEMHVKGRQDQMKMIVLHGRQAIRQKAHVVIVDQRQSADDNAVRLLGGFFDEGFPDEVAKRFGTVGVPAQADVTVEFFEKVGIDGYADAAEFAHLF